MSKQVKLTDSYSLMRRADVDRLCEGIYLSVFSLCLWLCEVGIGEGVGRSAISRALRIGAHVKYLEGQLN